jgi:hypothetical protein
MPYKTLEDRRKHYDKNKDEINRKRREYESNPKIKSKKSEAWKRWRNNNLEKAKSITNAAKKKYEDKCKELAFNHYGNTCACCGESIKKFLSIDHIDGGGTKHRKKIKDKICVWLYRNNFPEGFQTLCFNCNWGKHINGGICPHKSNS